MLLKYALKYEEKVYIPENFPARLVVALATNDDITKMFADQEETINKN